MAGRESCADEARWFFSMLGLREEQLWIHDQAHGLVGQKSDSEVRADLAPIPTDMSPRVKGLASELDVESRLIERRLPLLALPEDLVEKMEDRGLGGDFGEGS